MANLASLIFTYSDNHSKMRKGVKVFTTAVIKELNSLLNTTFYIKDFYVEANPVVDIEALISNDKYELLIYVYAYPRETQVFLFNIMENANTNCNLEFNLTDSPKDIAYNLLALISPEDIYAYTSK